MIDNNLQQYATERQWELLKALDEYKTYKKAAKFLNCSTATIRSAKERVLAKAAKQGYAPENDWNHPIPDGFMVKGVSTLYDSQTGEPKAQWVKSAVDRERQWEIMQDAIKGLVEELPQVEPTKYYTNHKNTDELLVAYPVGDHHIGMLVWPGDTDGSEYNTNIAEELLCSSIDYLVESSPNAKQGLLVFLGDFLHYDGMESKTPTGGNFLDSDTRFAKMVRVAMKSIRYAITKTLEKHDEVKVIVEIGNHDLSSSIFLMEAIAHIYENEPRVTIDNTPTQFHYHKFGDNLIGVHHGHGVRKWADLPLIMATDRPKEWGDTTYRYWWTGHIHSDNVKDFQGCRVESFRILAPNDAWAHNKGYRSFQDMKSIVIHKRYGEVGRTIVNPKMVRSVDP